MSGVVELPEQIGELQFLETLDLTKTSIRRLPTSILGLWRLVYLLVCNVELPDGVGDMQSLEELSGIQVNTTNSTNSLLGVGQLTKLRIVQLIWSISDVCGDIKGYEDNLLLSLKELSKLQSLSIESKYGSSLSFLDSWSPHPQSLQKLYLSGGYYFPRIPERIISLVNLDFLDIRVYQVEEEMMNVLGSLPALLVLSISSQVAAAEQRIVVQPGLFHCLTKFTLTCLNSWTGLVTEPEALPKLARLGLLCYVQGQRDPVFGDYGIKYLSSLKNLHVEITLGDAGIWEVATRSSNIPPPQVQISDGHNMVEEEEIIEAVESLSTHIEEESTIYKDAKMLPKPPTYDFKSWGPQHIVGVDVKMDSQSSQEGPEDEYKAEAGSIHSTYDGMSPSENSSKSQNIASNAQMTTSFSTECQVYGRDAERDKIIDLLIKGESGDLNILPVVGIGGIGKTTLARYVYHDKRIKGHFDLQMWVCVSTNFDVVGLTLQILELVCEDRSYEKKSSLNKLQEILLENIRNKRFLLVLDDMWEDTDRSGWIKLLAPLKSNQANGCMVLATTRTKSVAKMIRTMDEITLSGLDEKEFWLFFKACAFRNDNCEHHPCLQSIGKQIAKALKGCPLAARSVGALLSTDVSYKHWTAVWDKWKSHQEYPDDILPILNLSYDYLPVHLQRCFSYCSLFPKDYRFNEEVLVYAWMSQSFVQCEDPAMRLEETGQKYFDRLVDLGFFQKDGSLCVMHDLMHELAVMVSSNECATVHGLKPERFDKIP
ncbi:uncharacterized protein [Triticum aestivum]|uniref:uncharacterized protein n=1 Tax=Triticum aestivum TaxID=4565 RepID=UPI001D026DCD|nr:uncharacterized protein LOC123139826 [Triticum aestivum]